MGPQACLKSLRAARRSGFRPTAALDGVPVSSCMVIALARPNGFESLSFVADAIIHRELQESSNFAQGNVRYLRMADVPSSSPQC